MEKIIISVIIPVYNTEAYLESSINSVLAQSFTSYEIILINDGSTDRSLDICERYKNKYEKIHLYNQANKGVTAARRLGVEKANGDFILFQDSDDLLPNDALSSLFKYSENVDVVIGSNDNPIAIPKKRPKLLTKKDVILQLLYNKIDAHPSAKLWKRELFQCISLDTPPNIKLGEDLIMNLKLSMHIQKAIVIYKQTCIYLQHDNQTTKTFYHGLEYDIQYSDYLRKAINYKAEYEKGILYTLLFQLRRLTRFQYDNYDPNNIYVVETCRKALKYKLRFEDYIFILFKSNQKTCRFLLQKTASIKRLLFNKYH